MSVSTLIARPSQSFARLLGRKVTSKQLPLGFAEMPADFLNAYLLGSLITPLPTASTHISPDPQRTRKLLLHGHELSRLIGAVERKGYALVALSLYWKQGKVKLEIGLAKGKQSHDKRETLKQRDWERDRQRLMKIR